MDRSVLTPSGDVHLPEDESPLVLRFAAPNGPMSVVIEDDGRVAYAYLLDGARIVGDVWLYNVVEAPEDEAWRTQERPPFLNPKRFCASGVARLHVSSPITCAWDADTVLVRVGDEVWARLWPGAKPGCSRFARQAGPLAKPLVPP